MPPVIPPRAYTAAGRAQPDAGCAVAVGNFDGVHLGHAAIVRRLVSAAQRVGVPAAVMTFDPHPAVLLRPDAAPAALTTPRRRADLLLDLDVDVVLVQPVDRHFVSLEAEDFYREILRDGLRARAVVEGPDFRFGAGRRGDLALLERLCDADGVVLEKVDPVAVGGESVSSSRVRRLIGAGQVREAATLLTARHRATGIVVEGARRGRQIGFPTANLADVATLLPADGVYAGLVTIDAGAAGLAAAVHVGRNVTFGETTPTVEAHLIGWSGDLYGRTLHVDFVDRLRETRRFTSVEELGRQLAADVALAAELAAAAARERT